MIPEDDVPFEIRSLAHLASMEIGEWVVDRSRRHPRDIVADAIMADRASRLTRQEDETRRAALEEAGGWRPIETAPKDGTWIEAWRGPSDVGTWANPVYVRWWTWEEDDTSEWVWPDEPYEVHSRKGQLSAERCLDNGDCYGSNKHFTHWRPLPEPPRALSQKGDADG